MWQNEKLREFNDQIGRFKENNKETEEKVSNLYGVKTEYFQIIILKIISALMLMSISYWIYSHGLVFYEDIINNEIKYFTLTEYYSCIMLSFSTCLGGIISLFLGEIISTEKYTNYKKIIQFFKNFFILSVVSGMIGFILSALFCLFYITCVHFTDFTWSFYHNISLFSFSLPSFFYLTKKELKKYFQNQKEKDKHISEVEEKNNESNFDYTNKIDDLKEDFINSINTIDKYNFLKLTCSEMYLFNLKSFYNEIEENLLKETEFDDFKLYEKSIIRKRSKLNMIEYI